MIIADESKLRVKCERVSDSEIDELVKLLENELDLSAKIGRPGIGLAAPQIGMAKSIAIVRINDKFSLNLVNPTIDKKYDEQTFYNEGCLSFPGRYETTKRFNEIVLTNHYDDHTESFILEGLPAVVAQHETDHLYERLLPDVAIKSVAPKVEEIKTKLRPNDKCYCSSGLKYKKCHGKG